VTNVCEITHAQQVGSKEWRCHALQGHQRQLCPWQRVGHQAAATDRQQLQLHVLHLPPCARVCTPPCSGAGRPWDWAMCSTSLVLQLLLAHAVAADLPCFSLVSTCMHSACA
jgi:hypothetical protein